MLSVMKQPVPWIYPLPVGSDETLLPPKVGPSLAVVRKLVGLVVDIGVVVVSGLLGGG